MYIKTLNYNPGKKRKVIIMFDDMISNKKPNPTVTELFIGGRKINLNNFLVFMFLLSYFKVFKNVRLNFTHYQNCQTNIKLKIPNKRELQ